MKTTVIYDGLCALCNQSVRIVKRLDWLHRFEYQDLQDWTTVHQRFPSLDYDAVSGAMHIIRPDGKVFNGYKGIREIVKHLPLLAWLYLLLYIPGITWIGPKVYGWIATHRYQLNRIFGGPTSCENGVCKLHS